MIGQTPSLSFEIFPPKPEVGNEKLSTRLMRCRVWPLTLLV